MKSMTGFGSGRAESAVGTLGVELRSVNHRFLELSLKAPSELQSLEPLVRAELQKLFSRGRITVAINFDPVPGAGETYEINRTLLDMLEHECHQREQDPPIATLLNIPGVIVTRRDEEREEELRRLFLKAVREAGAAMAAERAREGDGIRAALQEFHRGMGDCLRAVDGVRDQVVEKYRERLKARLEELMGPQHASLDPGRLEQEVMFFADKADLAEESQRLGSHLERLAALVESNDGASTGRQLDFLSQEMLREVNTIGSKCRDIGITNEVLTMKNLIESFKEQIANVE